MSFALDGDRARGLLERLPNAVFCARWTPSTDAREWVYFSPQLAALYEATASEMESNPRLPFEKAPPEDRARAEQAITLALRSDANARYVCRVVASDGRTRWIETHLRGEPQSDGTVLWYGQSADVTTRERLALEVAEARDALAKSEALYRTVIDALPVAVFAVDHTGEFLIYNPAQVAMVGDAHTIKAGDGARSFQVFHADGVTPLGDDELQFVRALRGEEVSDLEYVMKSNARAEERLFLSSCRAVRDDRGAIIAAVMITQDVAPARKLEAELRASYEEIAASEAEKTRLIERLRCSVDELSNPIIEVWDDVLAMPVIGVVDSQRAAEMAPRLLSEVVRTQARFVIVDLTGVELVDTKTADHLVKLMRKVEIVGSRCVLTGIRPAVAETLVDLGVDFQRITTLRSLKHGLREALRLARIERDEARRDAPEGAQPDDEAPDEG